MDFTGPLALAIHGSTEEAVRAVYQGLITASTKYTYETHKVFLPKTDDTTTLGATGFVTFKGISDLAFALAVSVAFALAVSDLAASSSGCSIDQVHDDTQDVKRMYEIALQEETEVCAPRYEASEDTNELVSAHDADDMEDLQLHDEQGQNAENMARLRELQAEIDDIEWENQADQVAHDKEMMLIRSITYKQDKDLATHKKLHNALAALYKRAPSQQ